MNKRLEPVSKSLESHDLIPEMALGDFVRLLKDFAIISDYQGQPHWVRLKGPPYNSFVHETRSIRVMAHNRGRLLSPHSIKQVLRKFDISESQFRSAYNAFFSQRTAEPELPIVEPESTKPS